MTTPEEYARLMTERPKPKPCVAEVTPSVEWKQSFRALWDLSERRTRARAIRDERERFETTWLATLETLCGTSSASERAWLALERLHA